MAPGTVTAIMGESGAGKTSLLDIIAGRKTDGAISGELLVNGRAVDATQYRRISGYVLQDNVLLPTLTVKETLAFAAELRLPSVMSRAAKMDHVHRVMRELGLTHIQDTRVGSSSVRGISGGERKRVSIGCELVTSPSVLLLDEPTSGLDAANAYSIVRTVADLARSTNRTVVMTIHQPRSDIFGLFDQFCLLSAGRLAYFGPTAEAGPYFAAAGHSAPAEYNPADFFIDLVTKSPQTDNAAQVEALVERWPGTPQAQGVASALFREPAHSEASPLLSTVQSDDDEALLKSVSDASGRRPGEAGPAYASSALTQFKVITQRTALNMARDPLLLLTQYAIVTIVGLVLGVVYFQVTNDAAGVQNRLGCLFFMLSLLGFGSLSSLEMFITERTLYMRERAKGAYRTTPYFLAKALADLVPMRVLPPVVMGTISFVLIGGLGTGATGYLQFCGVLIMANLVATALCFAIASTARNNAIATLTAVLVTLFFMLFSGLLVNRAFFALSLALPSVSDSCHRGQHAAGPPLGLVRVVHALRARGARHHCAQGHAHLHESQRLAPRHPPGHPGPGPLWL